jgi:hypothetical protein
MIVEELITFVVHKLQVISKYTPICLQKTTIDKKYLSKTDKITLNTQPSSQLILDATVMLRVRLPDGRSSLMLRFSTAQTVCTKAETNKNRCVFQNSTSMFFSLRYTLPNNKFLPSYMFLKTLLSMILHCFSYPMFIKRYFCINLNFPALVLTIVLIDEMVE